MAVKPGDSVIARRYVGPPLEDATVAAVGEKKQQVLGGQTATVETATVRFADGKTVTVAADSLLPGGPNYAVKTHDGETWCESAAEITDAIRAHVESGTEGASLNKVSVTFMPPDERTGVGQQLSPADFYVGL